MTNFKKSWKFLSNFARPWGLYTVMYNYTTSSSFLLPVYVMVTEDETDCVIFKKEIWLWPSQGHQSMFKIDKINTPYSVDCKILSLTVTYELLRYGTLKRWMWFGLISQGTQGCGQNRLWH